MPLSPQPVPPHHRRQPRHGRPPHRAPTSNLSAFVRRTRRLDLATRIMLALEGSDSDHPVKLDLVLERLPAPAKFTAAILSELREAGVVGSARGSRGGYWIARSLEVVTLADLLDAVGSVEEAERGHPPLKRIAEVHASADAQLRVLLVSVTLAEVAWAESAARGALARC